MHADLKVRRVKLPREMRESLIRVGHLVGVFPASHSDPFSVKRGTDFFGQLEMSWSTFFLTNGREDPANCQRLLALSIDLHRDLIGCAPDSLGANFDVRLHVFDGLSEDFDRFLAGNFLSDFFHRQIEARLRSRLLAAPHHAIDELASKRRSVLGVWFQMRATCGDSTHDSLAVINGVERNTIMAFWHRSDCETCGVFPRRERLARREQLDSARRANRERDRHE